MRNIKVAMEDQLEILHLWCFQRGSKTLVTFLLISLIWIWLLSIKLWALLEMPRHYPMLIMVRRVARLELWTAPSMLWNWWSKIKSTFQNKNQRLITCLKDLEIPPLKIKLLSTQAKMVWSRIRLLACTTCTASVARKPIIWSTIERLQKNKSWCSR